MSEKLNKPLQSPKAKPTSPSNDPKKSVEKIITRAKAVKQEDIPNNVDGTLNDALNEGQLLQGVREAGLVLGAASVATPGTGLYMNARKFPKLPGTPTAKEILSTLVNFDDNDIEELNNELESASDKPALPPT